MNEIPTINEEPDEADELYRRLSDRAVPGPSEFVRRAVLAHAAELAAQVRAAENAATVAGLAATRYRWRGATYGGLAAAAVLAGLLTVPRFLLRSPEATVRVAVSPPPAETSPAPSPALSEAPPVIAPPAAPEAPRSTNLSRDAIALPRSSAVQGRSMAAPSAAPAPQAFARPRAESMADPSASLREAAASGDVAEVRRLLVEKPDLETRDARGRTALMLAVIRGHQDAVVALLAAGADPNAADAGGVRPLQAALAGAHSTIAAALEQFGAR